MCQSVMFVFIITKWHTDTGKVAEMLSCQRLYKKWKKKMCHSVMFVFIITKWHIGQRKNLQKCCPISDCTKKWKKCANLLCLNVL